MRRRQIVVMNQMREEAMHKIIEQKRVDPRACPKCGRIFNRGRVLHVKWCKGK